MSSQVEDRQAAEERDRDAAELDAVIREARMRSRRRRRIQALAVLAVAAALGAAAVLLLRTERGATTIEPETAPAGFTSEPDAFPWGRAFRTNELVTAGDTEPLKPPGLTLSFVARDGGITNPGGEPRAFVGTTSGCNRAGAFVGSVDDGVITSRPGPTTAVKCRPGVARQERLVSEFMDSRPRWRYDGEALVLTSGSERFVLEEAGPAGIG
ncbi:META domain-containing protein [Thermoleophilia bacterium SCSIO 60948]|nr:META domain-containing protein [Thermoleophilia bacterium SCSIO 60948]